MIRRLTFFFALICFSVPVALLAAGCASPESGPIPKLEPIQIRVSQGERRLVALLADNAGTETTDLLVPHGILTRSGAVDVVIVATGPGPVRLMPALTIMPDMTAAEFEAIHPQGADAVIIPAFHRRGTAKTSAFIQSQASRGTLIVSICEGAEPVARAGFFDGRTATTHWYARDRMKRRYPEATWVENTRYVIDGQVMSSSGVSASVPVAVKLLELLAGTDVAHDTAAELALDDWSAEHDSSRFSLDFAKVRSAVGNTLGFWRHEVLHARVDDGLDGVAFALQADAWSRTYRSKLFAQNPDGRVVTAEGVTLVTEVAGQADAMVTPSTGPPFAALEANLADISDRYGERTAEFVATQLEYAWPQ